MRRIKKIAYVSHDRMEQKRTFTYKKDKQEIDTHVALFFQGEEDGETKKRLRNKRPISETYPFLE